MASFHNWTGDEEIDKQVPQFLNEDNTVTQVKLDTKFNKSLEIAEASDLNNFMDEGFYCCTFNSRAETILNCPTNYAFGLMVWGMSGIVYQEVREYNRSSKNQDYNNCWRRSYYSYGAVQNAWSNWQKVAYTATTLAGYGITDGMRTNAENIVTKPDIIKRNVDTSYLRLQGGKDFNKGATLALCGGSSTENVGQFVLRAADSTQSVYFFGSPSGLLRWGNKNIVRSVNNINALDNGNVTIPIDTALDDKSTNPVQNKVIKAEFGNYYTKGNVDTLISNLKAGLVNVVNSLPTAGEKGKIYLVKTGTEDKNVYTEYVYVNSAWEKLGTQKLDLSGYLTVANANNTYVRRAFSDEFNFVSESAVGDAGKLYINFRLLNTNTGNSKPIKEYRFLNGLGNNLTRISAASFNGYTINASVPADAKFTDTVYTHPSTHPASMITGLSTVATSGSYNDLNNKPTIVKTVNNVVPDAKGNVNIATSSVTVDSALSSTSTNPVQNKAIYSALQGKVSTSIFNGGFGFSNPDATIIWRQNSQVLGSINPRNYSGTAYAATHDAEGNVIAETYAKRNTANTWTAPQEFQQVKVVYENYYSVLVSGTSHTPKSSVMYYNATGAFTLDLSVVVSNLSPSASTVFTAFFKSTGDYTLTIKGAGAIKYTGSASDVALTNTGLLLNILIVKDADANVTSIVQASKLA